jgi:hypothetical protein
VVRDAPVAVAVHGALLVKSRRAPPIDAVKAGRSDFWRGRRDNLGLDARRSQDSRAQAREPRFNIRLDLRMIAFLFLGVGHPFHMRRAFALASFQCQRPADSHMLLKRLDDFHRPPRAPSDFVGVYSMI